jgi:hypothetical protein
MDWAADRRGPGSDGQGRCDEDGEKNGTAHGDLPPATLSLTRRARQRRLAGWRLARLLRKKWTGTWNCGGSPPKDP